MEEKAKQFLNELENDVFTSDMTGDDRSGQTANNDTETIKTYYAVRQVWEYGEQILWEGNEAVVRNFPVEVMTYLHQQMEDDDYYFDPPMDTDSLNWDYTIELIKIVDYGGTKDIDILKTIDLTMY